MGAPREERRGETAVGRLEDGVMGAVADDGEEHVTILSVRAGRGCGGDDVVACGG